MADPGLGWNVLNWAWERKEAIGQGLASLYAWFRGSDPADERGILIIGPGGTGKTTLARILSGRYDWLCDSPWDYAQSVETEYSCLSDDRRVELVVPPGQPFRRESSWPDLLSELGAGKYRGVIYLASYGYHNLTVPRLRDHALYAGRKEDFLATYTAECRADELRILRRLAPHLAVCPKRLWLLLAVAKEDLWASKRREVEAFYRGEDFRRELEAVEGSRGNQFRVEPWFGSLVLCNLDTPQGDRLALNEAGYDQREHIQSLRRLLEIAAALRTWEGSP